MSVLDIIQAVKIAVGTRWQEVLSRYFDPAILSDRRKEHPCPKCGGETRFGLFKDFDQSGGVTCRKCFTNGADGIAAVAWILGCSQIDAAKRIAADIGLDLKSQGAVVQIDVIDVICRAKRMPREGLEKFGPLEATKYGREKIDVIKLPVYNEYGENHSHFFISGVGKGYCARGRGNDGLFLPLAKFVEAERKSALSELGTDWLMTEGVKDAAALVSMGYERVCGIPTSFLAAKYAPLFRGCTVVIVPDLDMPSVRGAQRTGGHLARIAKSIRVARLPGELVETKGDGVREVLASKGPDAVKAAIAAAEPWLPSNVGIESRQDSRQLDPQTEAIKVLNDHKHQGNNKLLFWSGAFVYWVNGKYNHIPNAEARALIVRSLNDRFNGIGTRAVSDVMEQVKANAMLSVQVQPPSWLSPNEWKPEDVIATDNAIVHLPSFVDGSENHSIPSTPALFTTAALNYSFQSVKPECPNWLAFLNQLWPNDFAMIETLQEWFGYCLTPDTRQQKILLMLGQKRSGKGTVCRVLRSVVGDGNVCAPTLSSLQQNFGLWPLLGKTVAIVSDARLGGRADQAVITERLLSISGEDAQTIDRKNLEAVTTKLSTRFMIVSNELPRLQDSSGALAGRMIVLRLTETFYGREDQQLSDRLMAERAGILHWAIDGWKRLRERGSFIQPETGKELVEQLNELSSPILSFVEDKCEVDDVFSTSVSDLYKGWCEWCREVGREPSTSQMFGRDLHAYLPRLRIRKLRSESDSRVRFYDGIRLIGANEF